MGTLFTTVTAVIVLGEGARLERVFENLVDNAISFSPDAGLVTIAIGTADQEAVVVVEDEAIVVVEDEAIVVVEDETFFCFAFAFFVFALAWRWTW